MRVGIYPWFDSQRLHTWYDPIYQYDRWRSRKADPHWEENEHHQYDLRRADKDLRPPRTYREMQVREAKLPEPQRRNLQMARPMSEAVTRKGTPMKFEPVSSSERRKISRQATDVDKFRDQRNRWESPAAGRKTVAPLPESKGTPAPSPQRKGPASASGERKGPATGPTTPTPAERKDSATRPTASTPTERKDSAAAPTERPSRSVSPRDVKVTKPETVKIPKSPIVGKAATENKREVAPPSKPTEERQNTRDTKGKDAEKKKGKNDDKSR